MVKIVFHYYFLFFFCIDNNIADVLNLICYIFMNFPESHTKMYENIVNDFQTTASVVNNNSNLEADNCKNIKKKSQLL